MNILWRDLSENQQNTIIRKIWFLFAMKMDKQHRLTFKSLPHRPLEIIVEPIDKMAAPPPLTLEKLMSHVLSYLEYNKIRCELDPSKNRLIIDALPEEYVDKNDKNLYMVEWKELRVALNIFLTYFDSLLKRLPLSGKWTSYDCGGFCILDYSFELPDEQANNDKQIILDFLGDHIMHTVHTRTVPLHGKNAVFITGVNASETFNTHICTIVRNRGSRHSLSPEEHLTVIPQLPQQKEQDISSQPLYLKGNTSATTPAKRSDISTVPRKPSSRSLFKVSAEPSQPSSAEQSQAASTEQPHDEDSQQFAAGKSATG